MNNYEIIDSMLSAHGISCAIPKEVRDEIAKSKKSVLKNILKASGKYTLATAVLINLVLFLKKFGIGISASKLALIVKIVVAVSASSAVAGTSVAAVRYYAEFAASRKNASTAGVNTQAAPASGNHDVKTSSPNDISPIREYSLEIFPLACEDNISAESSLLLAGIQSAIVKQRGEKAAVLSGRGIEYKTKAVLNGSFYKLNGKYVVSIHLVDAETSRVLRVVNKTASDSSELPTLAREIAGEVISDL